jgi:undecaprenyl-diphosphatase
VVNAFDSSIVLALNSLIGRYPNFDRGVEFIYGNDLIQGTLTVSMFWWYWFRAGTEALVRRTREHLIATLAGCVAAIAAGRTLAVALPMRIRPRFNPELALHTPPEPNPNDFVNWSSFPSDHAILWATLAVGICFVSVRVGTLLFLYMLSVSLLPLMYLGFHYPSDVIAGAAIGALIAHVMNLQRVREPLSRPVLRWEQSSPGGFSVALFMVTFQIASTFVSLREATVALFRFVHRTVL